MNNDTLFDENIASILQVSLSALEATTGADATIGTVPISRSQKVRDAVALNKFGISLVEKKLALTACLLKFQATCALGAVVPTEAPKRDIARINSKVPMEVMSIIFDCLPSGDLYHACLVCQEWYSLANRSLWRVPDPKTQAGFDKMLAGMIVGHQARSYRTALRVPSQSPVFLQAPGEYIRAIQYKYWFKLAIPFGELLIDYAPNLKVLPRIGFFSFMPQVPFFDKCAQLLKLQSIILDCLSPTYIDAALSKLLVARLKRLKIVNLDNGDLDSKFFERMSALRYLEHLAVSFSQAFSDTTLCCVAKSAENLKSVGIDFAPGLTLVGFCEFWNSLRSIESISFEHVNLFSNEPQGRRGSNHTPKELVLEQKLIKLRHLALVRTSLPTELLHSIPPSAKYLTKLKLSDGTVDDMTVALFAQHCVHIESLSLTASSKLTDASLVTLANADFLSLHSLSLDYLILLTDKGVASLFNGHDFSEETPSKRKSRVARRLVSLSMYGCNGLSDATAMTLSAEAGERLRNLNIGGIPHLSGEGVCRLVAARGGQLQRLSVAGVDVDERVLIAFQTHCSKLHSLDLGRQKWVDRASAEQVVKSLPGLRVLYADGVGHAGLLEDGEDGWDGVSLSTEFESGNGVACRLDSLGRLDVTS
ncbi:hypothetical protein HDU78_005024 [Chytriomyces hyalinus]|nr:hypothetical protein HDU78_005024 [Chytriomyces hyalinus]